MSAVETSARRCYVGHLSPAVKVPDLEELFAQFAPLSDIRLLSGAGFAFIQFSTDQQAEDAVVQFDGKTFMGDRLVVERAKEARKRQVVDPRASASAVAAAAFGAAHDSPYSNAAGGSGAPALPRVRRGQYRLIVSNLPRDTSWQDLKDFGREAGQISFADISRDRPGEGVVEYATKEDMELALRKLDGATIRGHVVRLDEDVPRRPEREQRERERERGRERGSGGERERERDHEREWSPGPLMARRREREREEEGYDRLRTARVPEGADRNFAAAQQAAAAAQARYAEDYEQQRRAASRSG